MSRTAVVKSVADVTPNMRRIVFGGPELTDFPVGKEGGYQFIFDEQVLLYKAASDDVTELVKAKL